MSALGKTYFKIKINDIDITETLKVIIDSIGWHDVLNASCEADFTLALPYDSPLKPTKGHPVDIYFNDILKFHGYITSISTVSNPEGISIHAEDEYHILNRDTVDFSVGRGITGTVYSTYKLALAALGLLEDIGNFIPEDENYISIGKADAISQIVAKCGTFAWFINPDEDYILWTAGYGDIVTLNRQTLGSNLGLYDVISHSIKEDDSQKIDKLKVITGPAIAVGWDNSFRDVRVVTYFRKKADDDTEIYTHPYVANLGWQDLRDLTGEKDTLVNIDGWIFTVPPGYVTPGSFNPLSRVPLDPKDPGFVLSQENQIADENIDWAAQTTLNVTFGGIYPEARFPTTFYIGSGDIVKILNLSNLNRQYGATYNIKTDIIPHSYQETVEHSFAGVTINFSDIKTEVIVPSWDDTSYATDIATMEYYKYKDTKISGQIQVTFDCIENYGINLSKRITIDGICTALNIKSIDYDVNSYLVTINLESENYYKRSVSIPSHI